MLDSETQNRLLMLLDWQRALGADAAIGDVTVDWLARGPTPPGSGFFWPDRARPAPSEETPAAARALAENVPRQVPPARVPQGFEPTLRPQTPLAPGAAETESRRIARAAATLEALNAALLAFDGCALKATAKNLVFYRGAPAARIMFVGEAPGREEDLEGKPFVGRAGQLLDKMLAAIGLSEQDVHITNVVYWRPPGNRTPTPQETLACRPFLERQIELVAPDVLVLLGGAAAKDILNTTDGIMRLRGKWRDYDAQGRKIPALATLHPAYLLRTPAAKNLAWLDLLKIKSKLETDR